MRRAQTAIDKEITMKACIRTTFLASMILFGAAASSSVYGAEVVIEEALCGGDYEPLCRKRTRKVCAEWYWCSIFSRCCEEWETTTVHDYFREPDAIEDGPESFD
jgi:hypothetical protein